MKRQDRNWTIVAMMYRDPVPVDDMHPGGWEHRCEKYVVLNGLKANAEQAVARWLSENPEHVDYLASVHYYPRNYVDDYRALTAAGRVIE